ncbi:MAG: bifunctional serine/threonine-protein kinase/formylglycine-generating enzyme family protein [Verrucomicrobiota bacterium]
MSSNRIKEKVAREPPEIPDHRVLRMIGHGAYGEVWLARGLTGSLRAVKVIYREDFHDEESFEREFEGIREFEPISRHHPGLVDVLHVGRNAAEGFYYYVMELGDDAYLGRDINPAEYLPRTVRRDDGEQVRLSAARCIEIGKVLAGGLEHLHENGLTHRDIKPSNVIFVNSLPCLADIGLVAATGRRTFVGTQGFVPPEGPGSEKADLFSLGMVLYEISTGKDRLQFPEIPDAFESEEEAKRWRALNEVVCRACAQDPQHRFRHAKAMRQALEAIDDPAKRALRWAGPVGGVLAAALAVVLVVLLGPWREEEEPSVPAQGVFQEGAEREEGPLFGRVKIISQPENAMVLMKGEIIGHTMLELETVPRDELVKVTIWKEGFKPMVTSGLVDPEETLVLGGLLENWSPPRRGEPWVNSLNFPFEPVGARHVAYSALTLGLYNRFLSQTGQSLRGQVRELESDPNYERAGQQRIVFLGEEDAERFRTWLTENDLRRGFLGEDYFYEMEALSLEELAQRGYRSSERVKALPTSLQARWLTVKRRIFGEVLLTSTPEGAKIYQGEELLGMTPLSLTQMRPGEVDFEFRLEGFDKEQATGVVTGQRLLQLHVELERNRGLIFGQPWENSLGMSFVPVGKVMFCQWETRRSDWEQFIQERELRWRHFEPWVEDNHPIVNIKREEAIAFCQWLTEREQARGLIDRNHVYRLPTDAEWSLAVGLEEEPGLEPSQLDGVDKEQFPWGTGFPPASYSSNLADVEVQDPVGDYFIPGYVDGFSTTSPVGTFRSNAYGLHDMAGNVWEWVADSYSQKTASQFGVLRGGCWRSYRESDLLSSRRNLVAIDFRDVLYGFRVVLAALPQDARKDTDIVEIERMTQESDLPLTTD